MLDYLETTTADEVLAEMTRLHNSTKRDEAKIFDALMIVAYLINVSISTTVSMSVDLDRIATALEKLVSMSVDLDGFVTALEKLEAKHGS